MQIESSDRFREISSWIITDKGNESGAYFTLARERTRQANDRVSF